ncbi:hypothetical protein D5274_04285 [bacterium 1XD42-94]|nr:hypothetical protein [bacterium 1XD42-76]NBK04393.1 hypothetical protein [bacterium 1XD42-94]
MGKVKTFAIGYIFWHIFLFSHIYCYQRLWQQPARIRTGYTGGLGAVTNYMKGRGQPCQKYII